MDWLVDHVEDGDGLEGCHKRMCTCVDYCNTPDTSRVFALTSNRLEERDFTVHQSLHPSGAIHTPEQR